MIDVEDPTHYRQGILWAGGPRLRRKVNLASDGEQASQQLSSTVFASVPPSRILT